MHSDVKTPWSASSHRPETLRAGPSSTSWSESTCCGKGLDLPGGVPWWPCWTRDKEGFLRSARSLIQTFGRAARNSDGRVILYADKVTDSMAAAMGETERRRRRQEEYNEANGITPTTIRKRVENLFGELTGTGSSSAMGKAAEAGADYGADPKALNKNVRRLEREMREAAKELEFERAAALRDRIALLRERILELG